MTGAPTIVLVHGGGHGAWCWEPLLEHLDRPAIAVDLPGRGRRADAVGPMTLGRFADAVVDDIGAAGARDVVLVGHSMAGLTLPLVADRLGARVRHAVFVAAIVAGPGEHMLTAAYGAARGRLAAAVADRGPERVRGSRTAARRRFCDGLPAERASWLLERLCPEWLSVTTEVVTSTWATRPRPPATYVLLGRDRQLRPARQLAMAERLGADCDLRQVATGHDAMVSAPAELAAIVVAATAAATG